MSCPRNVHRTLTSSAPTADGALTFRDYGLLICNAEALLSKARMILRGTDLRSFQEDINDLIERDRIDRQLRVVERMGWVFSRWIWREPVCTIIGEILLYIYLVLKSSCDSMWPRRIALILGVSLTTAILSLFDAEDTLWIRNSIIIGVLLFRFRF